MTECRAQPSNFSLKYYKKLYLTENTKLSLRENTKLFLSKNTAVYLNELQFCISTQPLKLFNKILLPYLSKYLYRFYRSEWF